MRQAVVSTISGDHQVPPRRYPNMHFLIEHLRTSPYRSQHKIELEGGVTAFILQRPLGIVQSVVLHCATVEDVEQLSAFLKALVKEGAAS